MTENKNDKMEERPWGKFEVFVTAPHYQVKRLTVRPGGMLSLQSHKHRSEHWVVVSGKAKVINGENILVLYANQSTYIPVGNIHRLENPGDENLEIIEVQTGTYLGEDDITRYEDIYNRVVREKPAKAVSEPTK
jgi:mannose-6-phosphate isomerase-like protein (cupin superfamily)